MQTSLLPRYLDTPRGREADAILRSCVHCGFCTATCPTYQLRGDELDGPRGRIYLIKQMLEGQEVTARTQQHLDRCLTCRACETTCPSGVRYARLLEIGRDEVERQVARPPLQRLLRWGLRQVLPYPGRFGPLLGLARAVRPLLPTHLKQKIPAATAVPVRPASGHQRKVLLLEGCAQSVATPATNGATARVLDRLGISVISPPGQGCCGAVSQHLAAEQEAAGFMRRNIDAWWPHIEAGAEAILVTASGCGSQVKEYGHLLQHDPDYAEKAQRVSVLARDLVELLEAEPLESLELRVDARPLAYQSPCSLQHGQQLAGRVEGLLTRLGFQLTPVRDSHLCCGSAGTYSLLQPVLSKQLQANKLQALQAGQPALIATANVGCQLHLASATDLPVKHWVELLAEAMESR
ncbi:MAG: glycolate oxidase subunit GlcF [Sedimenticola sp.]|nr:glycolate oxidase subunit GlcF [Sedimenticola sp.]